ncbi:MAG: hypothetical protein GXY48_13660 [Methanomicrobiales archaeon]|nr:hypothetical protein [Methanomicrobiales archaeon]
MNKKIICVIIITIVLALVSISSADRLPNGSNTTNRQIPSETYLEVIGQMSSHQVYQLDTYSNGSHEGGFLDEGETFSSVIYKNDMRTNGGYLAQSKGLKIDEGPQQKGGFNVDSKIVSTYLTDPEIGSKMTSSDSLEMFNSGNYTRSSLVVRNPVVADIIDDYIGGFNSYYKGASAVEMTTGQVATMARARSVGYDDAVPAELRYLIGIHPDMSSGIPYAAGTASTQFAMTNEEGAGNTTEMSSTKAMSDASTVDGQIFTFSKSFVVTSGIEPN